MLEIRNLTRSFGKTTAVNDLTMSVPPGTIMGFLGPNGAGKSTTMRIVATLDEPDKGGVTVDGMDVVENAVEVRRFLGYMPDFFGLYDDLKVWEYLDFFAAAHRVPSAERPVLIKEVLELTDLTEKYHAFVESLSRGMKQRLCLAKTLVHDPRLLLLDEPASGLDPRARIELRTILRELQSMGKTILISSHILSELSEFCSHLAIIERGKLLESGPIDEIFRRSTPHVLISIDIVGDPAPAAAYLAAFPAVTVRQTEGSTISAEYRGAEEDYHRVLTALVTSGFEVRQFRRTEGDVEDLFMRITKGEVS